jgi:integrase
MGQPMKIQLTTKGIEKLIADQAALTRRVDYFDQSHPGLCLTVGPTSASWFRFMRVAGKLTRIKLGDYPSLSLGEARKAHAAQDDLVEAGKHPRAEAQRQRVELVEAIKADEAMMLDKLSEKWFEHHQTHDQRGQKRDKPLSRSAVADYQRHITKLCHKFQNRDIRTLTRKELLDYLRTMQTSDGNTGAVVIRQLFQYARDEHDIPNNPAVDLRNPAKQRQRDRTLDHDEIRALWAACKVVGYPYGHALRLALCTGQRIGEIGAIKRGEISADGEWWIQTDNKASRRIDVYLAPMAREIVGGCPKFDDGPYLLSASGGERGLRSDAWSAARPRFVDPKYVAERKKQGYGPEGKPERERWTPHDLRRTLRSALTGECGVTPDIAERVLNHALPGLRKVYDHADYRPHVRAALEAWDKRLTEIIKGEGK